MDTVVARWRRPVLGAAAVWLAFRVVITGEAIVVHAIEAPAKFATPQWFFTLMSAWDSGYFAGIARHGYFGPESQPIWRAYFPGYPALAQLLAPGGQGLAFALWLVPLIASFVAGIALWRYIADRYDDRLALAGVVLFFAGAYSLYLVASYSEALYLAFAVPAWLCASRGRWLAAGILTAFATVTRINGVFLLVAAAVLLALALRRAGRAWVARTVGFLAIGVTGVLGYFLYLYLNTGSLLAWNSAQTEGWGRTTQWPWLTLYQTAGRMLFASTLDRRIQFGADIVFAALLVLAVIVLVRRRDWPATVLVVLTALPLMTSFTYVSLARNSVTLFPLVALVASSLALPRWRWIYWTVAVLGFALLLLNVRQFTLGLWAD